MSVRCLWALAGCFFLLAGSMGLLAGCGGSGQNEKTTGETPALPVGNATDGKDVFMGTCVKCHGENATGIEGSGPDLTGSQFIRDRTDAELVAYIKTGREMNDPLNKTGIAMPPYGANPALTDQDLANVVAYLRELQSPRTEQTPDATQN
jgi:mono/diheme cytochrome c family protein